MRRIRLRRPSPALTIAFVALLFSVAGTATAAKFLITSSSQIKNGVIQTVDLSKKARKALKGARGPAGPAGATGPQGPQGPKGDKGETGPYPTVLPSGQTLRGAFANIGHASSTGRIGSAISFPIPLAAPPIAHFIGVGTTPPAECPGTAAAPAAAPGHLCIYEGVATNVNLEGFEDPVTAATGSTTRTFGIEIVGFNTAAGSWQSSGSWAVTAP